MRDMALSRAVAAIHKVAMSLELPTPGDAASMTRWTDQHVALQDAIRAVEKLRNETTAKEPGFVIVQAGPEYCDGRGRMPEGGVCPGCRSCK